MKVSLAQVDAALRKHAGMVGRTASELGISRQAVEKRIKNNERLRDTLKEIEVTILEGWQARLLATLTSQDERLASQNARWWLERKGGFVAQVEGRLADEQLQEIVGAIAGEPEKLAELAERLKQE